MSSAGDPKCLQTIAGLHRDLWIFPVSEGPMTSSLVLRSQHREPLPQKRTRCISGVSSKPTVQSGVSGAGSCNVWVFVLGTPHRHFQKIRHPWWINRLHSFFMNITADALRWTCRQMNVCLVLGKPVTVSYLLLQSRFLTCKGILLDVLIWEMNLLLNLHLNIQQFPRLTARSPPCMDACSGWCSHWDSGALTTATAQLLQARWRCFPLWTTSWIL